MFMSRRKHERLAEAEPVASSGYLYLDRLLELEALGHYDMNKSYFYKFNRALLTMFNEICCTNLRASRSAANSSGQQKMRLRWPAKLMLTLYCLFNCHVITGLYYQYSYDLNLVGLKVLKLKSMRSLSPSLSGDNEPFFTPASVLESLQKSEFRYASDKEIKLYDKIQASRRMLNAIGASPDSKSIIIQLSHLFSVGSAFFIFGVQHIFYQYVTPFDFYLIREQLDYDSERESTKRLVGDVVDTYCSSDRLFSEIHSAEQTHSIAAGKTIRRIGMREAQLDSSANVRTDIVALLQMMLTSGALMPINRSSAWTRKRSMALFGYYLLMMFIAIVFFGFLVYISTGAPFMSNLVEMSNRGLMWAVVSSALTIGVSTSVAAADQFFMVNNTIGLISNCIQINKAEFGKHPDYSGSTAQQRPKMSQFDRLVVSKNESNGMVADRMHEFNCLLGESVLKMNANLLFTLMQYKILVREMRILVSSLSQAMLVDTSVVVLIPIMFKLHMPYLNLFQAHDSRLVFVFFCFFSLGALFSGILPICYLNARCMHLYHTLSNLVAHVTELESQDYRKVYDPHLVLTLLKEHHQSDRFVEQFTTRFLGVSGNYPTLVRMLFWWGLIMISILLGQQSNGAGTFDSFFSDPFGALSV